jgi:ABC-type nitrate/sulfonate/bicarbonate transport system substrate-binding protein
VGGVTDVYNSLRAGALDAAVVNAELAILGRREGFRELTDIAKLGVNFPTSSAVTTRSFVKRSENTVRKFVRGFVEGIHYAKTQRGPAIKIMQKYLRSSDAAMFDELYEMYIVRNIPRIPRPSPESLQTVLDQMAETDPRVSKLKPEQFIDARFFEELEKEGFLKKLWQ